MLDSNRCPGGLSLTEFERGKRARLDIHQLRARNLILTGGEMAQAAYPYVPVARAVAGPRAVAMASATPRTNTYQSILTRVADISQVLCQPRLGVENFLPLFEGQHYFLAARIHLNIGNHASNVHVQKLDDF